MSEQVNLPKDRMGQAVVSFIFSLVSVVFIIFYVFLSDRCCLGPDFDDVYFSLPTMYLVFFWIALFLNVLSIILGLYARQSSSARGFAYAAVTISATMICVILILTFASF